jgi:hypothetical protein
LILILLAANLLLSVVFVIYYIWLGRKVEKKKQSILFLFLDIPREEVRDIFKKCEIFLNFCNVACSDPELLRRQGVRQQQAPAGLVGGGGLFEKEMKAYMHLDASDEGEGGESFESTLNSPRPEQQEQDQEEVPESGGRLEVSLQTDRCSLPWSLVRRGHTLRRLRAAE